MTEPEYEWGVEFQCSDGRSYVGFGYSEDGARRTVATCGDPKFYEPHAARAMRRPVAAWSPVPPEGKQAAK